MRERSCCVCMLTLHCTFFQIEMAKTELTRKIANVKPCWALRVGRVDYCWNLSKPFVAESAKNKNPQTRFN